MDCAQAIRVVTLIHPVLTSNIVGFGEAVSAYVDAALADFTIDPAFTTIVASGSGNWNSVYSSFNLNSAQYLTLPITDARYVHLSGDVMTGGLSTISLSTNNLYVGENTIYFFNSGLQITQSLKGSDVTDFKAARTTILGNSASWANVSNVVAQNSAQWLLSGISVEFDPVFTTWALANSARFQSTYNTVNQNSAIWQLSAVPFDAHSPGPIGDVASDTGKFTSINVTTGDVINDKSSGLATFGYSNPAVNGVYGGFDGSAIHGAYFQLFGKDGAGSGTTPPGGGEFIIDSRNGPTKFTLGAYDGATFDTKMVVTSDGKVGIASSNPTHALEVEGEVYGRTLIGQDLTGSGNALEIRESSDYNNVLTSIDNNGIITVPGGTSTRWNDTADRVESSGGYWDSKQDQLTPNVDYLPPNGNGAALTNLNAGALTSGQMPPTRLPPFTGGDVIAVNGGTSNLKLIDIFHLPDGQLIDATNANISVDTNGRIRAISNGSGSGEPEHEAWVVVFEPIINDTQAVVQANSGYWPTDFLGTAAYTSSSEFDLYGAAMAARLASLPISTVHNVLSGLQGGTTNQFYHLTFDELGTVTAVPGLSSNWQNAFTTVRNNSASWANAAETDPVFTTWALANSGNFQSNYNSYNANSGNFQSNYNSYNANSGNFQSNYTAYNAISSKFLYPNAAGVLNSGNVKHIYIDNITDSSGSLFLSAAVPIVPGNTNPFGFQYFNNGQVRFGFSNTTYINFQTGPQANLVGSWNFPSGASYPQPLLASDNSGGNDVRLIVSKSGNGGGQTVYATTQRYATNGNGPDLLFGANGIRFATRAGTSWTDFYDTVAFAMLPTGNLSGGGTLTMYGDISSNGNFYTVNGNSSQWNSAYTTVNSNSATWNNSITTAGANLTKAGSTLNLNTALTGIQSIYLSAGLNPLSATIFDLGTNTDTTARPFTIQQTANNVSLLNTVCKIAYTNTSSSGSSLLLDAQTNGSTVAKIRQDGVIFGTGIRNIANTISISDGVLFMGVGGTGTVSNALYVDTAGYWAMRNGSTAHSLRIYNTYTSLTYHERAKFDWAGNVFTIGTEKGSVGGNPRGLNFQTDGTNRMTISPTGTISLSAGLITNSLITGNGGYTSADWDAARTTVFTNSASWANATETDPVFTTWALANSGNFQSTFNTVFNTSASWGGGGGGGGDPSVNTFVYANSATIINVDTVVQANSAAWATAGTGPVTGPIDNAALRANGTGGASSQGSFFIIDDLTTSTQDNIATRVDDGSTSNISMVFQPKGTGAFILGPKPDGTSTGGNARGSGAVDLMLSRNSASQGATGDNSFAVGQNNTASAPGTVAVGVNNIASGYYSFAGGNNCQALYNGGFAYGINCQANNYYTIAMGTYAISNAGTCAIGYDVLAQGTGAVGIGTRLIVNGNQSFATGESCTTNNNYSFASGYASSTRTAGMRAHSSYTPNGRGDMQAFDMPLFAVTTDATTTECFSNYSLSDRFTIPNDKAVTCTVTFIGKKAASADVFAGKRQVTIVNNGGTVSLVGTVNTIGTDAIATGALTWAFNITADNTNKSLKIEVTGQASTTIKWVVNLDGVESLAA